MVQKKFVLNIRKRTAFECLTLWILIFPLFWGVFFDIFKLPSALKYTADVAWVLLLFAMIFKKQTRVKKDTLPLLILVLGLFVYVLAVYLFNFQSPLYFLWGVRNTFRYYVYFFAVINFFDKGDIKSVFRLFDVVFWLNTALVLIQFFLLGYKGDYLGGVFGVQKGCNAYMIIFFCIVLGYSILNYMTQKESLLLCMVKSFVVLVVSALAELKVFFVLFILILVLAALFTKFSWKSILLVVIVASFAFFAISIMVEIFNVGGVFTLEGLWELATQDNYSSKETVNRLSAIPTLSKLILTEPIDRIFGLGIGNCETSAFSFLNTPFYQQFSYLKYSWFSCAKLFLEIGYIGIIIYLAFFVVCFMLIWKNKKLYQSNSLNCQMGMIMAIISVIMFFYNSSLHIESGYMVYFILALAFVSNTSDDININNDRNVVNI